VTKADSFLIGDIVVEIVRSSRRKSLSIEVGVNGVKARAPSRMRHGSIVDFVTKKQDWIRRHIAGLPEPQAPLELKANAKLLLQGKNFGLSIVHGSSKPCYLTLDSIVVPVKQSHLPLQQSVGNKLVRWYKLMAYEELQRRVALYSSVMSIPNTKTLSINVRDYKRRWGSCDRKGGLSFNWRIIQAPPLVFDYVVIHELAHCHEFNHSKKFWAIVASQMPDWRDQQHWLQCHGTELYRI
jgi:predicted metal-dependent hydrolase